MRSAYTDVDQATQFSRGFDRGNYGNAYESQDWESWSEGACHDNCPTLMDGDACHVDGPCDAYREGMLLGFFSSYELHEIGDEELRDQVEALRIKHGDE